MEVYERPKTPEEVLEKYPLKPTCDTFSSYLAHEQDEKTSSLELSLSSDEDADIRGSMVCSGVASSGLLNYTGQCCDESGGIVKWAEKRINASSTISAQCYYPKNGSGSRAAVENFKTCMEQRQTWPVCANASKVVNAKPDSWASFDSPHVGATLLFIVAALATVL